MSMYNIALSGLNASRTSLNVSSQNVANATTEGYSRLQTMQSSTVDSQGTGNGVEVSSIRRVADDFIISQLRSSNTTLGNSSYRTESLGQIEEIVAFDGFDIATGLSAFFGSISEATVTPESSTLRQQIIADAQSLSERFNGLSNALQDQNAQISSDRETTVANTNGLLENIATSNKAIMSLTASGKDATLLEDERDLMLNELSSILKVNVNKDDNGAVQLSMANGQPLLINGTAATLSTVVSDPDYPYQAEIEVTFNNSVYSVSGDIGGELGAMQTTQKNDLQPMLTTLNSMAKTIADEVNATLEQGTDLNGDPGTALFSYDSSNPASSLTLTSLTSDTLAFSKDGESGNGEVLDDILAIANTKYSIGSATTATTTTLSSAFSTLMGKVAIDSRQAQSNLDSQQGLFDQIQAARDSLSGVNSDEEAANLLIYANAYEANMKVISVANQMFNTLLSAF